VGTSSEERERKAEEAKRRKRRNRNRSKTGSSGKLSSKKGSTGKASSSRGVKGKLKRTTRSRRRGSGLRSKRDTWDLDWSSSDSDPEERSEEEIRRERKKALKRILDENQDELEKILAGSESDSGDGGNARSGKNPTKKKPTGRGNKPAEKTSDVEKSTPKKPNTPASAKTKKVTAPMKSAPTSPAKKAPTSVTSTPEATPKKSAPASPAKKVPAPVASTPEATPEKKTGPKLRSAPYKRRQVEAGRKRLANVITAAESRDEKEKQGESKEGGEQKKGGDGKGVSKDVEEKAARNVAKDGEDVEESDVQMADVKESEKMNVTEPNVEVKDVLPNPRDARPIFEERYPYVLLVLLCFPIIWHGRSRQETQALPLAPSYESSRSHLLVRSCVLP